MNIRQVIYTQEPGIDGEGITAIEKEQLVIDVADAKNSVDRIAPAGVGAGVEQARITVLGPRWLPPDTVSPLLFDAAGDGSTDDYAALMQAHDAIKATGRGGTLHLGGKRYRSNTRLVFDHPIVLDGGGMGIATVPGTGNQSDAPLGGEIQVPAGVGGLLFDRGSWGWTIRDVSVTSLAGGSTPPSSDVGIEFRSGRGNLSNVTVRRFSKGVWLNGNSASGYNTNCSLFEALRVRLSRGHGLHLQGSDANANVFEMLDVMQNSGYGVLDESDAQNKYYGPHFNANTLGAMHLKTRSAAIRDPYAEAGNRIEIDTTVSQDIRIECASYYAAPQIWSGPTGNIVEGFVAAFGKGCTLSYGQSYHMGLSIETNEGSEYQMRTGTPNTGNLSIRGMDQNQNIISVRSDASMPSGIGFHGTTPRNKPTITGSRGGNTALANLLTALASYGLITDGTTS